MNDRPRRALSARHAGPPATERPATHDAWTGRRPFLGQLSSLALSAAAAGCGAPFAPPVVGAERVPAPTLDATLRALLADASVTGVIVLQVGAGPPRVSDLGEATARHLPASTFKVANALLGVELGLLADAESVIPWDGVIRPEFPEWNRTHTLESAFAVSNVPWFQALARAIGLPRMRAGLARLGYGNRDVGEVVDRFWLDGPLAISALEQLDFLTRLETGRLPVRAHARDVVRRILVREIRDGVTLRGKTGWGRMRAPGELGWFVGYAGEGPGATTVAVRVHRDAARVDDERFRSLRIELARRALATVGAYPTETTARSSG